MKRTTSSAIVLFFAISSLLVLPKLINPQTFSPNSPEDLGKRVSQLEEKVKSLEAELSELRRMQKYFAVPGLPPGMKNVPPDWKPYHYRGQTIYLVPLDSVSLSDKKK
jgi:hypothetical protein